MERNNVMNYKTDSNIEDNYKLIPLIESGQLNLLKELKWNKKGSLLSIFDGGENISKNGNNDYKKIYLKYN